MVMNETDTLESRRLDKADIAHLIYSRCLRFIRDNIRDGCIYMNSLPVWLMYTALAIGLFNNSISLLVFYQPKFRSRALPLLKCMKYFYVSNMLVTVTLLMNIIIQVELPHDKPDSIMETVLKRTCSFLYQTFQKMAVGILAYLSLLRCYHQRNPTLVTYSINSYRLTIVIIMILFVIGSGLHFKSFLIDLDLMGEDDIATNAVFYCVSLAFVIAGNLAWIVIAEEWNSEAQRPTDPAELFIQCLFKYAALSSLLFIITCLPITVYLLIPMNHYDEINCDFCLEKINTGDYLLFLMYNSCFFDNMLYYIQSSEYRNDVKSAMLWLFSFENPEVNYDSRHVSIYSTNTPDASSYIRP